MLRVLIFLKRDRETKAKIFLISEHHLAKALLIEIPLLKNTTEIY